MNDDTSGNDCTLRAKRGKELMVYADNAASMPMRGGAKEAFIKALDLVNPSSTHYLGAKAYHELAAARNRIADILGVEARHIFFTSGGTEANNIAMFNAAFNGRMEGKNTFLLPPMNTVASTISLIITENRGLKSSTCL